MFFKALSPNSSLPKFVRSIVRSKSGLINAFCCQQGEAVRAGSPRKSGMSMDVSYKVVRESRFRVRPQRDAPRRSAECDHPNQGFWNIF